MSKDSAGNFYVIGEYRTTGGAWGNLLIAKCPAASNPLTGSNWTFSGKVNSGAGTTPYLFWANEIPYIAYTPGWDQTTLNYASCSGDIMTAGNWTWGAGTLVSGSDIVDTPTVFLDGATWRISARSKTSTSPLVYSTYIFNGGSTFNATYTKGAAISVATNPTAGWARYMAVSGIPMKVGANYYLPTKGSSTEGTSSGTYGYGVATGFTGAFTLTQKLSGAGSGWNTAYMDTPYWVKNGTTYLVLLQGSTYRLGFGTIPAA
jgi:hypothetical protein